MSDSTAFAAAIAPVLRGALIDRVGVPVQLGVAAVPVRSATVGVALSADAPLADQAAAIATAFGASGLKPGLLPASVLVDGGAAGTVLFYTGADADAVASHETVASQGTWTPEAMSVPSHLSAAARAAVVYNRVALVTGGAQGFGAEISTGLAQSGAFVWIADLNLEGARSLAQRLNHDAGRTVARELAINVADEASVQAALATVATQSGGLDLVISNAGVLKAGSVLEQDLASFKLTTDVNYVAFFIMTKFAGRLLRAQAAAARDWPTDIIQINSKSGLEGSNKNGAYAGSKFGAIGLVESFALELVEYDIKVNAICPGNFFDGPLWSDPEKGLFVQYLRTGKVPGATTIADVKKFYEAKVPMKRGCEGPDVMRAIYYIVDQRYETGQAVPVTGGQVMLK